MGFLVLSFSFLIIRTYCSHVFLEDVPLQPEELRVFPQKADLVFIKS